MNIIFSILNICKNPPTKVTPNLRFAEPHLRLNIKSVVFESLLSITLLCNYIFLILVNI